jgi:hypothetical protein
MSAVLPADSDVLPADIICMSSAAQPDINLECAALSGSLKPF